MTERVLLNAEEKQEIGALAGQYADRRAACIDALKVVQRHRGWVADDGVHDVAAALGMSTDEVDGVATFYNLIYRRPVGQHVILLCDSVSCWIMGYERLRERLHTRLGVRPGETTVDGRFTLLPVPCLGACERAPALMVDGNVHGGLAPDDVDAVLESYT